LSAFPTLAASAVAISSRHAFPLPHLAVNSGESALRLFSLTLQPVGVAVAGTIDDCRARIAAYGAAGVTDLVLTFVSPDPVRDMARFSLGPAA